MHRNPELSFKEFKTSEFIAQKLREFGGIEVTTGIGITGVIGVIRGGAGAGPCIALRADMDALPIFEKTGCACSFLLSCCCISPAALRTLPHS